MTCHDGHQFPGKIRCPTCQKQWQRAGLQVSIWKIDWFRWAFSHPFAKNMRKSKVAINFRVIVPTTLWNQLCYLVWWSFHWETNESWNTWMRFNDRTTLPRQFSSEKWNALDWNRQRIQHQPPSTESFFLKLPHFWGGWFLGPLVGSFPHILTAKSRYSHPSPVRQAERRRLRQTSDVSTAHSKVFVLRTNCIRLFLLNFFFPWCFGWPEFVKRKRKGLVFLDASGLLFCSRNHLL